MTSPVWHPFTQHGLGEPIPKVASASGAVLTTVDGREVIDAISSWWVTTHGHNHPRISAAIAEQAGKLDQIIFAGWTHEPAEEVAAELVRITPPKLTRVFFSDSGSTAVEVALKMALGYWLHRGEPRHRILVLEHSYHGDTIGAMSVGARGVYNQAYAPLLFDVGTIPYPTDIQATLDTLEAECRAGAAAFIVEPLVLGAGGMLFYAAETLAAMREICAAHGVLFIADEVMTGWGRTGTIFACDQAGVVPDILCLSKGLTGGAVPLAVTLRPRRSSRRTGRKPIGRSSSSTRPATPPTRSPARRRPPIWRSGARSRCRRGSTRSPSGSGRIWRRSRGGMRCETRARSAPSRRSNWGRGRIISPIWDPGCWPISGSAICSSGRWAIASMSCRPIPLRPSNWRAFGAASMRRLPASGVETGRGL